MFAFGRTIDKVKGSCDPTDCDGADVNRAEAMVAHLCEHKVAKRMCAADAVENAFFAPARCFFNACMHAYTHTYAYIHT
jgi:hypothetical protein